MVNWQVFDSFPLTVSCLAQLYYSAPRMKGISGDLQPHKRKKVITGMTYTCVKCRDLSFPQYIYLLHFVLIANI